MSTVNQAHAAMLQLIAEGIRSPAAGTLSRDQLERVAGLLDRIAVDLLVPTQGDAEDRSGLLAFDTARSAPLHS
jgi:hypothetical protein